MSHLQTPCSQGSSGERAVVVTGTTGIPRHFRVQLQSAEDEWRLYGRFLRRDQAEECLVSLRSHGQRARLVECNRTPVGL